MHYMMIYAMQKNAKKMQLNICKNMQKYAEKICKHMH